MSDLSSSENGTMTLRGHLRELRKRIIICAIAFIAGFLICFSFARQIITVLTDMGTGYGYHFIYLAPQELLMVYFNVAMLGGLIIALPVIASEIYQFAKPGLSSKETRSFFWSLVFGAICFVIGILFAYKISLPFMLYFLISFGADGVIHASISIQEYLSFVLTVFIIFGCVFEMPVISVLLARLGILKPEWMLKGRKVAIVIIFVVAAIITPPDVASQILVAVPMIALYEISIALVRMFYQKHAAEKSDAAESE